nr:hypothetical protein StreXyl84_49120 [Streptomyces sp. Xyl84]
MPYRMPLADAAAPGCGPHADTARAPGAGGFRFRRGPVSGGRRTYRVRSCSGAALPFGPGSRDGAVRTGVVLRGHPSRGLTSTLVEVREWGTSRSDAVASVVSREHGGPLR